MAHLWLMQAVKEELKKNNGAFVISASVAGLRPGGSSMVSDFGVGHRQGGRSTSSPSHSSVSQSALVAATRVMAFTPRRLNDPRRRTPCDHYDASNDRISANVQAYSVTKAGSVQLTRSLAKACAPEVRVNAVAAGVMEMEWSQGFSPAKFEQAKKKAALNKISDVEDVAKTYVDLIENGSMTVSNMVNVVYSSAAHFRP